jgi:hypothetical protein
VKNGSERCRQGKALDEFGRMLVARTGAKTRLASD